MRPLHVVRLVEGVDDRFPVRGKDRRLVRAVAHRVEVVRLEQFRDRMQEVEQGLGAGVEVDEHEATPCVEVDRCETHVGRQCLARGQDRGMRAGEEEHRSLTHVVPEMPASGHKPSILTLRQMWRTAARRIDRLCDI